MDNTDLIILDLFTRYLAWIKDNGLVDTLDNYINYFHRMEKVDIVIIK